MKKPKNCLRVFLLLGLGIAFLGLVILVGADRVLAATATQSPSASPSRSPSVSPTPTRTPTPTPTPVPTPTPLCTPPPPRVLIQQAVMDMESASFDIRQKIAILKSKSLDTKSLEQKLSQMEASFTAYVESLKLQEGYYETDPNSGASVLSSALSSSATTTPTVTRPRPTVSQSPTASPTPDFSKWCQSPSKCCPANVNLECNGTGHPNLGGYCARNQCTINVGDCGDDCNINSGTLPIPPPASSNPSEECGERHCIVVHEATHVCDGDRGSRSCPSCATEGKAYLAQASCLDDLCKSLGCTTGRYYDEGFDCWKCISEARDAREAADFFACLCDKLDNSGTHYKSDACASCMSKVSNPDARPVLKRYYCDPYKPIPPFSPHPTSTPI